MPINQRITMKTLTTIFMLLFAFILNSYSQDVIYKKDGSKEEAKITLVGDKNIQYKKFSNLEGPVYTMPKSDIVLITYENGQYELMQPEHETGKSSKQELSANFTKNMLGYHLFDVVYGDFTISYERILSSGTVGISIPIGFGYAYNTDYFGNSGEWVKNLFYSGVGVNFYPTGQGKWRYFLGPEVRIGYGKTTYWQSVWDDNGNYISDYQVDDEGVYTKFFVNNGVMFTPVRNLSVSAIVGMGVRYFPEANYSYDAFRPSGYYSMNLYYRF